MEVLYGKNTQSIKAKLAVLQEVPEVLGYLDHLLHWDRSPASHTQNCHWQYGGIHSNANVIDDR